MIRTGKRFSKPEMSRVVNGDRILKSSDPEDNAEKIRLDLLMTEIYKSYNRSTLQKFIENGFVTVDGEIVTKSNTKIPRTVKLGLKIPEKMKHADVKPKTIYEDENVLVVNKPTGLLSEAKGEYCPEKTLADFGLIAHRLDRDTSGVMILAKNPETQIFLKKQFQNRTVHKTYYAIVSGRPKLDEAKIDLPLIRDLKRPTTFRVDANGKEAETYYRVIRSDDLHSLLELKPRTGRTHQLRVHLNYLNHPIIGDVVYNGEKAPRLMLHATELEITLPGGLRKTFSAPLPKEFTNFFEG